MISSKELAARCAADPEFRLAARYWDGGFAFVVDGEVTAVRVVDGEPEAGVATDGPGVVSFSGSTDLWATITSSPPPRFFNDLAFAAALGLRVGGDELTYWQYYPAMARAVELLRAPAPTAPAPAGAGKRFDTVIGRYVHLELDGLDHRVYFEEAGTGIPLLMQHTAGSHSVQWRHLFEDARITDHFRLIAYDLPFHGKSIPPIGACWWEEQYQLSAARLRSIPVTISRCLDLERPAFMGCSVGGLLALDLALHHPKEFRAVISLEGTLKVTGRLESLIGLWHPQVSDETKARMMEGMMAPTSPLAYRKETIHSYSAGWSPLFVGDLHYYYDDFDLTDRASDIDTSKVAVHILSGEYDYSAPQEQAQAAHEAIAGSTYQPMDKLGHFPMSEDPQRFLGYLLPILKSMRETSA
jgi:pimeloyl-ACP methyl ester carboxylesterase